MIVLGIESSCDETAASVVTGEGRLLSNIVFSQLREHETYGGVVPEIAARSHLEQVRWVVGEALQEANVGFQDLDAIAATGGPGLIGGVLVGTLFAKGAALALNIPYIPVNHLEGHALTCRLTDSLEFPFLLLLVSGGHCQFLLVRGVGDYERLGTTMDDAVGEAFDKTGKLLGLSYPAGPKIEELAKEGNVHAFDFPKPLYKKPGCDFSFSGLKTAVRQVIQNTERAPQNTRDICASFQRTVGDVLVDRTHNAILKSTEIIPTLNQLVIAGGVSANQYIKARLETLSVSHGFSVTSPPIKLCTDNGAMIAWAGVEYMRLGHPGDLAFSPRPRWPLDELKDQKWSKS